MELRFSFFLHSVCPSLRQVCPQPRSCLVSTPPLLSRPAMHVLAWPAFSPPPPPAVWGRRVAGWITVTWTLPLSAQTGAPSRPRRLTWTLSVQTRLLVWPLSARPSQCGARSPRLARDTHEEGPTMCPIFLELFLLPPPVLPPVRALSPGSAGRWSPLFGGVTNRVGM